VGFEPTISAGERPKTYTLDRAGTGTGTYIHRFYRSVRSHLMYTNVSINNTAVFI